MKKESNIRMPDRNSGPNKDIEASQTRNKSSDRKVTNLSKNLDERSHRKSQILASNRNTKKTKSASEFTKTIGKTMSLSQVVNKTTKPSKKERRFNKKITRKHPEFELTYDMMLGIRYTVSQAETSIAYQEQNSSFSYGTRKISFPKKGSSFTPAHNMNSFKFKDYCGNLFKKIRQLFKVQTTDYLISLCSDFPYLEFVSNSNSGQFFFYSHDRRFMIKTQTKRECAFLRKILPYYLQHIEQEKDSLLTQFLGMHRVTRKQHYHVYFIIMSSVFYSPMFINEVYDLKGSTTGRFAKAEEKNQMVPILKDNDFVKEGVRINLGPKLREKFFEQVRRDCRFLVDRKIMDYSLILGIHFCDSEIDMSSSEKCPEEGNQRIIKRQSIFALKKNRAVNSPINKQFKAKAIPLDFEPNDIKKRKSTMLPTSVFANYYGGVKSYDRMKIYFLGIIDILQTYNAKKKFEHKLKSLKYKKDEISAVSPENYAKRLIEFLEKHVD